MIELNGIRSLFRLRNLPMGTRRKLVFMNTETVYVSMLGRMFIDSNAIQRARRCMSVRERMAPTRFTHFRFWSRRLHQFGGGWGGGWGSSV